MENRTNSSSSGPRTIINIAGPGFRAFMISAILVLLISVALIIITIVALIRARVVPKVLRVFLVNLLLAGLCTALVLMTLAIVAAFLNFSAEPPPNLILCRLLVWAYIASATTRLHSLPAFSIVVLLMVKYKTTISPYCIVPAIISLWTIGRLLDFNLLVPAFYSVQLYDNVVCFPKTNDPSVNSEAGFVFVGIWVIFGGVVPMSISILVPLVVLCYVKRNTITETTPYKKGLAKFALFLAAGNTVHILGHILVTLISVSYSETPSIYISYAFSAASLLPTPIMVILYLKPVHKVMKITICCFKVCTRSKGDSVHAVVGNAS